MRLLLIHLTLVTLVFVSAVSVVMARHEARQAFIEHQAELEERDALNLEWTQLQLEQATWATQARIEATARDGLGMIRLTPDRIVYIEEGLWER